MLSKGWIDIKIGSGWMCMMNSVRGWCEALSECTIFRALLVVVANINMYVL